MGALADAGVTMKDIGVLAAGNLMAGSAGIGQQLQKQIGQTGIPVYNVANACATGATALRTAIMAVKAGEADIGPRRRRREAGRCRPARRRRARPSPTRTVYAAGAATAPSATVDGRIGTDTMPGVFAQIGMEYRHDNPYDGAPFELFAKISEKNHGHSTPEPAGRLHRRS